MDEAYKYLYSLDSKVLCAHMYMCMVLNMICCSTAFQVYKVAREERPTLSTLALALLLLSPQVYVYVCSIYHILCVCRVFTRNLGKW